MKNKVRDAEVVNDTAADTIQQKRREKEQEVAAKIEAILIEAGLALQPFLAYSEYGVVPRVRLVENVSESKKDGQGDSETKSEESGDADKSTEPIEA